MIETPTSLSESGLWQRLGQRPVLQKALLDLREVSAAIGAQAARLIPGFTDHSVRHMDALWLVTDQVFTEKEVQLFSAAEAFVLGASFYVHDLGMAFGATMEGMESLQKAEEFATCLARVKTTTSAEEAKAIALQIAAREMHAKLARDLVTKQLPGLSRFLIETTDLREKWGDYIADVSASHHWSLPAVENKLGSRGKVPDPLGGEIDLGMIACALRIIDYAHINFERASQLDRLLRSTVDVGSVIHWKAQEFVTGPRRQADLLVFGCTQPIRDVEAWWLFFEIATGLDREIHTVGEYLSGRAVSTGRFSLEGVKGVRSPKTFATYVLTAGFDPIDVRFRPDSVERLVDILGGRTLYGADVFAPLRELLQNARDAIQLRQAADTVAGYTSESGQITVSIEAQNGVEHLHVIDNGVGMSEDIVSNYLLGIASDYWHSASFFSDYPRVTEAGFRPAGRFGIGFLSVFMIGDRVEIQTQRSGGSHLSLSIYGLGRRGALVSSPPGVRNGTTVRVEISKQSPSIYRNIDAIVRARAPMLSFPIRVVQPARTMVISPGWWKTAPQDEFHDFINNWEGIARTGEKKESKDYRIDLYRSFSFRDRDPPDEKWPGRQPELITDSFRIMAIPDYNKVLLCSRGLAVRSLRVSGIVGIAEIDELELTASRSTTLEWDADKFRQSLVDQIKPAIVGALNNLSQLKSIPNRFGFIASVGRQYGRDVLVKTQLPWITFVEPPGNAVFVSGDELKQRLQKIHEIIVAFGADPWSVSRIARRHFAGVREDMLFLPVPTRGQPDFGSFEDKEIVQGPLVEHFDGEESKAKDAVLLNAVIDHIADAWKIDRAQISDAKWSREKDDFLIVQLSR